MKAFKQGDFVTTALQGDFSEPRPALVVQSDAFNEQTTVKHEKAGPAFDESMRMPWSRSSAAWPCSWESPNE